MQQRLPHTFAVALRFFLFLCNFIICVQTNMATPPPGYTLVWADEFDGTSFSATNWSYRYLGVRDDAVNVTNAVAVTNGTLIITTYTQNGTNYTGMISTDGKYAPRYGYLEASIKWSDSPGQHSAYWLQSDRVSVVGNPHTNGTEIDVVEHRAHSSSNADISNQAETNLHWDGYGTSEQSVGSGLVGSGLATNFHTYALEWTPTVQRFYLDGAVWYAVTNSTALDPLAPAVAVSQTNEYIILSSEVQNSNWVGTIPSGGYGSLATSTTKMTVDYLHVYQLAVPLTNWMVLSTNSFSADGTFHCTNAISATNRSVFFDMKAVP